MVCVSLIWSTLGSGAGRTAHRRSAASKGSRATRVCVVSRRPGTSRATLREVVAVLTTLRVGISDDEEVAVVDRLMAVNPIVFVDLVFDALLIGTRHRRFLAFILSP